MVIMIFCLKAQLMDSRLLNLLLAQEDCIAHENYRSTNRYEKRLENKPITTL